MNGIGALIRRGMREITSLPDMWGYSKKASISKPGRGLSTGTELADTLILDFPVSSAMRNECLLFKLPPGTCYSQLS